MKKKISPAFYQFYQDENGQGSLEYALILSIISIAAIIILVALNSKVRNMYEDANSKIWEWVINSKKCGAGKLAPVFSTFQF